MRSTSTTLSARRALCWFAAGAMGVLACTPATAVSVDGPVGRVTVTERTRVDLQVRLIRKDGERTETLFDDTVSGMAGDPLEVSLGATLADQPVKVGLVFVAGEDQGQQRLPLRMTSRVRHHESARLLARVRRSSQLPRERLRLFDLWAGRGGRERLILALSCSWEQVPRAVAVTPEARPVDLVVEVLRNTDGGARQLLERHRLSTLIGSPASYTFLRRPRGATAATGGSEPATEPGANPGRLQIEILPDGLDGDQLGLAITISHRGEDIYSDVPEVDVRVRHEVGPGFSVDVPLPGAEDRAGLVFRITPYF